MRPIASSAVETLTSLGYTELEAKRIRPYLPKHFQIDHPAPPRTNVEFWLAYYAAQHFTTSSANRGKFTSELVVGFWPYNNITYTCDAFTVSFSEIEFIRHFGEALFTDFDTNLGRRVVALNNDGSLKLKNRPLQIRLREIEVEIDEIKNDYGFHYGWFQTRYHTGNLQLPPRGCPNVKTILSLLAQAALALEFQVDAHNRRMLSNQLDYVAIAKFLFFLEYNRMRGMPLKEFSSLRNQIFRNMLSRSPINGNIRVDVPTSVFMVPNKGFFTADGFRQFPIGNGSPYPSYYIGDLLVRYTDHTNSMRTCVKVPESLYDMFTDAEWAEAVSA